MISLADCLSKRALVILLPHRGADRKKKKYETVLSHDNGMRDYASVPLASSSKERVSGFPLQG
jgi:hypothetical protein